MGGLLTAFLMLIGVESFLFILKCDERR
jgi:hypothetical protein